VTTTDPTTDRPRDPRLASSAFLAACRGSRPARTPVWFMRQAGRSLPEYRRVREGVPMLESCRRPELVAEITLQPVRRYGVDAAILYSDIVVPLAAAGIEPCTDFAHLPIEASLLGWLARVAERVAGGEPLPEPRSPRAAGAVLPEVRVA